MDIVTDLKRNVEWLNSRLAEAQSKLEQAIKEEEADNESAPQESEEYRALISKMFRMSSKTPVGESTKFYTIAYNAEISKFQIRYTVGKAVGIFRFDSEDRATRVMNKFTTEELELLYSIKREDE